MLQGSMPYLPIIYNEIKFWSGFVAVVIAVYRAFQWVKAIRTNDLPHIQAGVDGLKSEIKEQTSSIVKAMDANTLEVKELRRELFTAIIAATQPQTRAARAAKRNK